MGSRTKDIVKYYIKKHDREMQEFAEKLGMSKQGFTNKLTNETIKYTEVEKIADELGYKLVWKKKI